MAKAFIAPRHTRGRILVALLALTLAAGARAEEADEPKQELRTTAPTAAAPADAAKAGPSGQKGGGGGCRGGQAAPAATAEQHRLPPDSTTKHSLALPGRMLSFTAIAGSIRLFDVKGEPQADYAYTSYHH